MCRLIETIKYRNGKFHLLFYHEARANHARKILFGINSPLLLNKIKIPQNLKGNQTYKCRVVYQTDILEATFHPYHYRPAHTFQCVYDNQVTYPHKFDNRMSIETLEAQKGEADDIIIIKNQLVTDAANSNLAFLKNGKWYTPNSPLLMGTKRAYYLDIGMIIPAGISVENLHEYEKVCRINAFMNISEKNAVSTEQIRLY